MRKIKEFLILLVHINMKGVIFLNKQVELLKEKFREIKGKEFCESLREGYTGIGFTFESLLEKKEDNSYNPDVNGIEIKTRYGYSKAYTTLFCLTPKGYENTIEHLLKYYGYSDKDGLKSFKGDVFSKKNNVIANKFIFKLKVAEYSKQLKLIILDINLNVLDKSIYWDLSEIKNRVYTKLNFLALINGYPYKRDGKVYYKYTSLDIYKLKSFNYFLEALKNDEIYITFNIGTFKSGKRLGDIHDHGTAFKLKRGCINKLFDEYSVF